MIKVVDNFLNGITMYRLMLYVLIGFEVIATVLSFFHLLPFNFISLLTSAVFLTMICWGSNLVFAKLFKAPTNLESAYITALILTLIITPIGNLNDLPFLFLVGILAMASKYILAINRKHLFNPAAFAVAITATLLNNGASWWVGTAWMMLFVIAGGILIVRKIQRFDLVFSFLLVVVIAILGISILKGNSLLLVLQTTFADTPILFFAFIMLTEPLTTPPRKIWRIIYGSLVGLLYVSIAPEIALVLGNVFSYLVSPKEKLLLRLKKKIKLAPSIYDFIFNGPASPAFGAASPAGGQNLAYLPGQYLEWTLPHRNPDSRGTRRYFTIASSPTEETLRIGVKFSKDGSSFKKALLDISPDSKLMAGQLAGEFTLPQDPNQSLCFLAGGIGITPYRSMIKYLLDTSERRNIILLYAAKGVEDFVYTDIFQKAKKLGIKTIYLAKEKSGNYEQKIKEEVSDYKERIFYISGPHSMVDAFEDLLIKMGIPKKQIKVDFFPGYA